MQNSIQKTEITKGKMVEVKLKGKGKDRNIKKLVIVRKEGRRYRQAETKR